MCMHVRVCVSVNFDASNLSAGVTDEENSRDVRSEWSCRSAAEDCFLCPQQKQHQVQVSGAWGFVNMKFCWQQSAWNTSAALFPSTFILSPLWNWMRPRVLRMYLRWSLCPLCLLADSYCQRLQSSLLCLCDIFQALINSIHCVLFFED